MFAAKEIFYQKNHKKNLFIQLTSGDFILLVFD